MTLNEAAAIRRAERIAAERKYHAELHAFCKHTRRPNEAFQRLCLDPCHKAKR